MRMTILDYGLFEIFSAGRRIGIPGYYIESGTRRVLVDTGFHPDYVHDPDAVCRADGLGAFGRLIDYRADQNPIAQLALVGVAAADITDLILTHGHIDHVGRIDAFPNATLWVSAAERAEATPYYWEQRSRVAWPNIPTERIDAERTVIPGLTLIPTPGHTVGHLSVEIVLPEMGTVLLTADAISRPDEAASGVYGDAADAAAARASAALLLQRAHERQAWVIYGHCPQQWRSVRTAPHWYR